MKMDINQTELFSIIIKQNMQTSEITIFEYHAISLAGMKSASRAYIFCIFYSQSVNIQIVNIPTAHFFIVYVRTKTND